MIALTIGQAPRVTIRRVIWILASDTGKYQYFSSQPIYLQILRRQGYLMTTSNHDHHHFKDSAFAGKVGETSSLGVVNFPVPPFLHLSSYLSHFSLCIIKYFLLLSFIQFFLNVFSKSFKINQIVFVCYQHYQLNL